MPKNKKLAKATRARMARTGESYSTARMHLASPPNLSDEEHTREVDKLAARVKDEIGVTFVAWSRLLLNTSGFPVDDWDENLVRSQHEWKSNPTVPLEAYQGRSSILDRAALLMRVQMDLGVMDWIVHMLLDRATDLTGQVPKHQHPDRFNDELDQAIDLLEDQFDGAGHLLMSVQNFVHYNSTFVQAHGHQETWTCAYTTSGWDGWNESHLLRAGLFGTYRGYAVLVSKTVPFNHILAVPDPTYTGFIRTSLDVQPGPRDKNLAFHAQGTLNAEVGWIPETPIYTFNRSAP